MKSKYLYFNFKNLVVPEAVQDERAALNQFKTEFTKRYRQQQQPGPNFSTKIFSEAVQEAFGGSAQSRRALGSIFYAVNL